MLDIGISVNILDVNYSYIVFYKMNNSQSLLNLMCCSFFNVLLLFSDNVVFYYKNKILFLMSKDILVEYSKGL